MLSFIAEDETGQGQFFAYDIPARNIVRRDVRAVLIQQGKEPGFPRFLTETISRKYTLHVTLRDESFVDIGEKIYFVKAVLPNHELQAHQTETEIQIQSPPAAPASSQPALPTVQNLHQLPHTAPSPSTQVTTYTAATMLYLQM
jgi:hypothetical protein